MWFAVYIPPVLVIAIFAVGFIIWRKAKLRSEELFSLKGKDPKRLSVKDVKPMVDLMTSRLAWFATATVFFVASLSCIVVSLKVILEMRSDSLSRSLLIGLPPVTAILGYLGFRLLRSSQYSGPLFLDQLLNKTSGDVVSLQVIGFFNALAFVGIAFIVGGSCAVIASTGRSPDEVSRQVNDLGMLLYAGAALLVTSVLEINQLHRWSGIAVAEDVRHEIHRAAAVLAGTVGTLFSLMLAAAYVPAFMVLQSRGVPANAFHFGVVLSPFFVGLASTVWSSFSWPTSRSL